jgi:hypothetical protein
MRQIVRFPQFELNTISELGELLSMLEPQRRTSPSWCASSRSLERQRGNLVDGSSAIRRASPIAGSLRADYVRSIWSNCTRAAYATS